MVRATDGTGAFRTGMGMFRTGMGAFKMGSEQPLFTSPHKGEVAAKRRVRGLRRFKKRPPPPHPDRASAIRPLPSGER
jgi:hypothetical protein